jgi:hypothetical protein
MGKIRRISQDLVVQRFQVTFQAREIFHGRKGGIMGLRHSDVRIFTLCVPNPNFLKLRQVIHGSRLLKLPLLQHTTVLDKNNNARASFKNKEFLRDAR